MLKMLKKHKSTVIKILWDGLFMFIVVMVMFAANSVCNPSLICGVCPGAEYFNVSNLNMSNFANATIIK